MQHKRWILFDFDGTLADSSIALLGAFNYLSREFHYKKVSIEELSELRQKEGVKLLLDKLGWKFWNIPRFTHKMREEISLRQSDINMFDGVPELLKTLQKEAALGIISSNNDTTIKTFLKHFEIDSYFEFVIGNAGYFNKRTTFLEFMRDYKAQPEDIVYVADEGRDIKFCRRLNIPIIAVTWGYDDIHILKKKKPTYLATNVHDIITLYRNHAGH